MHNWLTEAVACPAPPEEAPALARVAVTSQWEGLALPLSDLLERSLPFHPPPFPTATPGREDLTPQSPVRVAALQQGVNIRASALSRALLHISHGLSQNPAD